MAGVPVVACWDGGGLLDVVPETGAGRLTLPSAEAMSDATLDLLQDPRPPGARQAGRRVVARAARRRTTWPSCARGGIARRWVRSRAWMAAGGAVGGRARDHRLRRPQPGRATGSELRSQPLDVAGRARVAAAERASWSGSCTRCSSSPGARCSRVGPATRWLDAPRDLDGVEPGQVPAGKGVGRGGHGADGAAGGDRPVGRDRLGRRAAGAGHRYRCGRGRTHRAGAPSRRRIPGRSSRSCCWSSAPSPASALLLWPPVLRRLLRLAAPDAETPRGAARRRDRVRHRRPIWSRGSATGSRSGCLARGLLPAAGLGRPWRSRCSRRRTSRVSSRCSRPEASGSREGLFILMLQGPLGIGAATALALASRVLLTDHRVRRRGAVSRLPAGESACRTLSPHPAAAFEPRRPALLARGRVRCWPRSRCAGRCSPVAGCWATTSMSRATASASSAPRCSARRDTSRSGTPISSAACRSSPPSTATSSIRRRGSGGCCRSTRAMNLGFFAHIVLAGATHVRLAPGAAARAGPARWSAASPTSSPASWRRWSGPGTTASSSSRRWRRSCLLALLRAIRRSPPVGVRPARARRSGSAC